MMLGDETLKKQSLEVLNELVLVQPAPSSNPKYHARFKAAKETIQFLITQKRPSEIKFYQTFLGKMVISVISSLIAAFIIWKLGWN